MFLTNQDNVHQALKMLDSHSAWPPDAEAVIIVVGGAALAFYNPTTIRETDDLDGILLTSSVPSEQVIQMAEQIGISFRAGSVMWMPEDWEDRIQWSNWEFRHLRVGWLDPYDWVISKLGRWIGHDSHDVEMIAAQLDPETLYHRVRQALPDFIGDEQRVRWNWRDLVEGMQWSPHLRNL
ncbi:hypothetical protein SAMN00768000_0135 [Sulfobacillus thermosulfidooxidans DSM 9293]|uniref:DUF6036 domain-containing protein n=1 Tax=Sulfobacillus thermosulfidooxidans (strain DSM 9293 / VKM B-1269 / AT-1) TaxID=929705 RepID=A0A1W1W6H1_SULTA|nr:DUF6036 family nucleotidyltransferase [Sulfobacillus thermosulfidooxidans]SMC01887.1 hypothetical protein SAMN00768000_0135 [Sulfobacillus thermosulfidooxidans DSM 9293]